MATDKNTEVIEKLIRTMRMHKSMIESSVGHIGIHRTQHKILMHLARHGSLPSQKDLAAHLNITPAAVTGALKSIEQAGYIERKLGQDNRYNELQITERGLDIVNESQRLFSEADRAMLEDFSDVELAAISEYLDRLQSNVQKYIDKKENLEKGKDKRIV